MKLFLTGYMGSGKSTVAEQLSQLLNLAYIEMDHEIERMEELTIPEIFEHFGEEYFRRKETELLKNTAEECIISTGGGVILKEENRRLLKKGVVIYLNASWDTICERLVNDQTRPLWNGNDDNKKEHFTGRLPLYKETADIVIDVDNKKPEVIAKQIVARLNSHH
ncbi:shikimate kinase [Halobacillus salinarum]|uniref:Shikimate kinase n=1 Tax=Halobacillus salinarum TaxID=2932257 RepID=A0ABY4EET0_9BACI|nr:shikimate kinase [Halobacillus salinarum]UOQ42537.1 shikimate kinase [Halobacillus salinarum]